MTTKAPPLIDPAEIIGMKDIAGLCGEHGYPVKDATVDTWRRRARDTDGERDPMPPPDGWLSGSSPWWFRSATIIPWLARTGRGTYPKVATDA